MQSALNIAELVSTRLSHDLIGNIGAVSNAIELLDDDPSSLEDIRPILEIGSRTLTARLKFFRLAFGLNNAAPQNIADIKTICEAYLSTIGTKNSHIELDWQIHTPALYKIIMLSLMSLADLFIKSGSIKISETTEGLSFSAHSEHEFSQNKIAALENLLKNIAPSENPAQYVPLIYLQAMLEDSPVKISLSASSHDIRLEIS